MNQVWCSATPTGIRLALQITANAKKSEVIAPHGDALKIRLQAPAIEGRANQALTRLLADCLNLPTRTIEITAGQTSKRKIVEIRNTGLTVETVVQALWPAGQPN
jgi:uncharacterized protein (TIGR00251 family)